MRAIRFVPLFLAALAASVSPVSAQILYGAEAASSTTSQLFTINTATAATVNVGPIGFAVTGLAQSPITGIMYGVTSGNSAASPRSLVTINLVTGAGTLVGALGTNVADITFFSDGTLYGWSEPSRDNLCTINLVTGTCTDVGDAGLSTFGSGLAFNLSGTLFFAGNGSAGDLRTINRSTGLVASTVGTLSGSLDPGNAIAALAFHPGTGVLYGVDGLDESGFARLVTINPTTAVITTIGSLPNNTDAIGFSASGVPTMPTGMFLLMIAAVLSLALFALARRTRLA